ncbi:DUF5655 domain-containing protein [Streptomyces sp. NPDC017254]|uniref:DUF5655 domain-containing protein n=1 Tax=unclassified Streptomyces TaxID=2593676 RepID=UPI00378BF5DC
MDPGEVLGPLPVRVVPGIGVEADRDQDRIRFADDVEGGEAVGQPPVSVPAPAGAGLVPECLRDLFAEVDEALTAWGEVEVAALRHYIAYRRLVNVASVIFRPKRQVILVYLRLDPDSVVLEEGFTRGMRGVGHLGTGDLEVRIASVEDLEKAAPLIRRAFEAA